DTAADLIAAHHLERASERTRPQLEAVNGAYDHVTAEGRDDGSEDHLAHRSGPAAASATLATLFVRTILSSDTCIIDMPSGDYLVWIDLEMTGLKPDLDVIIEIATVVTDKELAILAEGPVLAIHHSDEVLARMDEWNQRQHGSSGLLARVRA